MAIAVRVAAQGKGTSGTSIAATAFSTDPVTGDGIVVILSTYNNVTPVTHQAPTDTQSNSYSQIGTTQADGTKTGFQISMWLATNITGGSSFVVTGNMDASVSYRTIVAYCLSGAATSSLYNGDYKSATGIETGGTDGLALPATTVSPAANSLAITAVSNGAVGDNTVADGTGWSSPTNGDQGDNTSFQNLYTEYKSVSATYTATFTSSPTALISIRLTASFAPSTGSSVGGTRLAGIGNRPGFPLAGTGGLAGS